MYSSQAAEVGMGIIALMLKTWSILWTFVYQTAAANAYKKIHAKETCVTNGHKHIMSGTETCKDKIDIHNYI
jgi:hypothetical protein